MAGLEARHRRRGGVRCPHAEQPGFGGHQGMDAERAQVPAFADHDQDARRSELAARAARERPATSHPPSASTRCPRVSTRGPPGPRCPVVRRSHPVMPWGHHALAAHQQRADSAASSRASRFEDGCPRRGSGGILRLPPLVGVVERGAGLRDHRGAGILHPLHDIRVLQARDDVGLEPRYDRRRHAGGQQKAVPGGQALERCVSGGLAHGGHVREAAIRAADHTPSRRS